MASAPLCFGLETTPPNPAGRSADQAIRFLEKRVADDPEDFIALNQLAGRYLQRARETGRLEWLDRAEQTVAASLSVFPADGNPEALLLRGQCDLAFHRFDSAMKAGVQLHERQPDKTAPLLLLGDALVELGDFPGAEWAWTEAANLLGNNPAISARLARLAALQGRFENARNLPDAALEQVRKSANEETLAWTLVQRGELEFKLGKWDAAEPFYQNALMERPAYWGALDHLAELRAEQGRWDEALELALKVAEATARPEISQAVGDIATAAKRSELARDWHDKAERLYLEPSKNGDRLWAHHLAGFYADSREKPEDAVRWARKDLEHRSTAAAHDALAWALFKAGDVAGANEAATRALSWNTADSHLLFHAGMIRLAAGKIAEGRALLARSAEINPREQSFHLHR
jgi:tetratricopeptide (TPR) repeat protein